MATWQLLSGPATRAPDAQLSKARDRKFTFRLKDRSTAVFTIDGRTDQALDLLELATDIHATRNGQPLFTGRLTATQDDFNDLTHTVSCNAIGVRGLLDRRTVLTDRIWEGIDLAVAVKTLLDEAQAGTNTPLGITVPTFPATGIAISRAVKAGASITAELAAITGGTEENSSLADWDVTPGWPSGQQRTAQLWAPRRGRDLTGTIDKASAVVLVYRRRKGTDGRYAPQSSPVASVTRSFDPASYANHVLVTGGVATQKATFTTVNDKGQTVTTEYSWQVPTTPVTNLDGKTAGDIGTWSAVESHTDIVNQAELQAYAEQRAAQLRTWTPTYAVTLRDNYWGGPDHVWLGDTVRLILDSGRLQEDADLRVEGLDVETTNDGTEKVTLIVGAVPTTSLDELLAHSRRLALLERTSAH